MLPIIRSFVSGRWRTVGAQVPRKSALSVKTACTVEKIPIRHLAPGEVLRDLEEAMFALRKSLEGEPVRRQRRLWLPRLQTPPVVVGPPENTGPGLPPGGESTSTWSQGSPETPFCLEVSARQPNRAPQMVTVIFTLFLILPQGYGN